MNLQLNYSYIFKKTGTNYPSVRKGTITDVTQTTVKIKWEEGTEYRHELTSFKQEWIILEELKPDLLNQLKRF
jgi:hypothetical protein